MTVQDQRDRWAPALAAARPWTPPARRTIVVAPHPDDESLSSGGLIAFQRDRGLEVVVVAVTDGEASHDPDGELDLARIRRREQSAALDLLGVGSPFVRRLDVPDGHVASFETEVALRLVELLRPDDLVVASWSRDVHPDHEACGRAAFDATRVIPATLVYSLFWTWHHRRVDEVDRSRLLSFALPSTTHAAKQRAIRQHVSQFETRGGHPPILDDRFVEPATWPTEYFLGVTDWPDGRRGESA